MAIWNDPQPDSGFGVSSAAKAAYGARGVGVDAGLRAFLLQVYNYMASGVLLTGIVAMAVSSTPALRDALILSPARILFMLAPLGFVLVMSFGINRLQASTLRALFWAYVVTMGISLSVIFLVYTGASIAATFFASAAAFAGLSLVGYTTKRDLSAMGSFMIMGLFGLIIASLINLFLHSSGLQFAISVLGVLIFAGLTAWDTQKLKAIYYQTAGTAWADKMVVMGALTLYLDFINMFMFMLRFMGNQRR